MWAMTNDATIYRANAMPACESSTCFAKVAPLRHLEQDFE